MPSFNYWHANIQYTTALNADITEASIAAAFPKLTQYREMMLRQPYVQATSYSDEEYDKFVKIYRNKDLVTKY